MSHPLQQTTSSSPGPRKKPVGIGTRIARVIAAIAIAGGLVWLGFWVYGLFRPAEDLYRMGHDAFAQKDYASAEKFARRMLSRDPNSKRGMLLSGMIAAATERPDEALEYFAKIPDDGSIEAGDARSNAGVLLLDHYKQPMQALDQFQKAYTQNKDNPNPNNFIPLVLRLGTRTREMIPYEIWAVKAGPQFGLVTPRRLYELSLGHALHTDQARIEACRKFAPDDPIVRLGLADIALYFNRYGEAEEHYRHVIESHPEILEAHVRLGQVFLQSHELEKLVDWNAKLPPEADQHPLTWATRGKWADERGQRKAAIRCYWESAHLDPTHLPAIYRLGQLLVAEGMMAEAQPFLERARLLELYGQATHSLNVLTDKPVPDVKEPLTAAGLSMQLGLIAEASAWLALALRLDPNIPDAPDAQEQLVKTLEKLPDVRTAPDPKVDPTLAINLSSFPLPNWSAKGSESPLPTPMPTSQVSFEDVASAVGIDFQYFEGGDPEIHGLTRVYRFNGGGVAVLDYDCDGWPDIYLTQGAETPDDVAQIEHLDRLYRNTGDGRFEDVTVSAGIAENRYSQGATVGDYNSDGFPDLYVANFGGNKLYRNNGDGTFDDVSEPSGAAGNQWTSSCLMADLNGDALPDIYEVNYLEGENVLTTVCRDKTGKHHACMPLQFASAQDQLYLNRGDGTFENVTDKSGIVVPNGKGLGIVAADFEGTGKLNLFIANDGVPNFYFVNETPAAGDPPKFSEQGLVRGLAYNRNGTAQAGMGVAAGDSNADGLLDMVVTNFYAETSTLYRQQPDHLFIDDTETAQLDNPSRNMLGFGTQFLDGALRGAADLVVSNGHIDNLEADNVAYEMPPQYFSNRGDGTFAELAAESVGPYFQGNYLGRGLSRIDWNRDGKEDVAISHLDAPAALLSNTTKSAGHFLKIRLVGVKTARDAIGTTLTLNAGGKTQVRQLTAGDGYEASNERVIIFGLGDATTAESLDVKWLSGEAQKFTNVAADSEYLCVEGSTELMKLTH